MFKELFAVLSAFTIISYVQSVIPAGKCKTEYLIPVPLDMKEFIKYGTWKLVYAPNVEMYRHVEKELGFLTVLGAGNYKVEDKKVMKDKLQTSSTSSIQYINNVLIENGEDEKKNRRRYYNYPVAVSPTDMAILVYRCSDAGSAQVDTRYICMPEGKTLSKEGEALLLAADRKIFSNSEPMVKISN